MSAPAPSFGQSRPSAGPDADTSPRRARLTSRGEMVAAAAVFVALFLALWAAEALGFAITNVPG